MKNGSSELTEVIDWILLKTNSSSLALYTCQINFYSGQERLVKVGGYNDDYDVKTWGGRVETFEIASDERLIGAELAY